MINYTWISANVTILVAYRTSASRLLDMAAGAQPEPLGPRRRTCGTVWR